MGKTEWFRQHRYRADAVRCEDQDLLLRTHENSRFAALPEIVLGYREEELSLKKILTGRRYFLRSVVREATAKRKYAMAVAAILEQSAKGMVDCAAIGTGLNYRILRHRASPVDAGMRARWAEVWASVQSEEISSVAAPLTACLS